MDHAVLECRVELVEEPHVVFEETQVLHAVFEHCDALQYPHVEGESRIFSGSMLFAFQNVGIYAAPMISSQPVPADWDSPTAAECCTDTSTGRRLGEGKHDACG